MERTESTKNKTYYPVVVGFGIPGIDIKVKVTDDKLHKKYNVPVDGELPVTYEFISNVKEEIFRLNLPATYELGGSCLQTLLELKQMTSTSNYSAMIGAIGNEAEGEFVREQLHKNGIIDKIDTLDFATCVCIILVYGATRTVIAYNSAGEHYNLKNLRDFDDKLNLVKESQIVLIEGFFAMFSVDVAVKVFDCCKTYGQTIIFNLSAVYVAKHMPVADFYKMADVIVGNNREFKALVESLAIRLEDSSGGSGSGNEKPTEGELLCRACHEWLLSQSQNSDDSNEYKKIVVITDHDKPIYCAYGSNAKVIRYDVPYVDQTKVENPVGAGDAFVAGFILGYVQRRSVYDCVVIGTENAQRHILKVPEYVKKIASFERK